MIRGGMSSEGHNPGREFEPAALDRGCQIEESVIHSESHPPEAMEACMAMLP